MVSEKVDSSYWLYNGERDSKLTWPTFFTMISQPKHTFITKKKKTIDFRLIMCVLYFNKCRGELSTEVSFFYQKIKDKLIL